jgi:hypothetical protein
LAHDLETIDWAAPWFAHWREPGQTVANWVAQGLDCCTALNRQLAALHRTTPYFVPQSALPDGLAYEAFIFHNQQVPTRNGLHDFFNGLCWLRFPVTKRRLNQLQAAEIALAGIGAVRGVVRDRLTVLDENAILMQAPDAVWVALQNKDWHTLFGTLRPLWRDVQVIIFGHALLEKLTQPRKNMTGHVLRVPADCKDDVEIDRWLAKTLTVEALKALSFAHLPVLGVPGWHPENTKTTFYDEVKIFRMNKKP